MDYFVLGTVSDLKLIQFAPWLENILIKKEYRIVIDEYSIRQALARMRYKNYYAEAIKPYINPPKYIDEGQYAPNVLYIGCTECFNEWLKLLNDTTTKVVIETETSEHTYYDTVYVAKYISQCLFTLFMLKDRSQWNINYAWFFWPSILGMDYLLISDKSEHLPYNRDKLQKFINEGYPFYVSRYYYKYIR
jgi:hypothetical protein